jgi:cellulose synthase (UDP-forming)
MLQAVPSLRRSPAARTRPARLVPEGPVGWLRPALPGRGLPAPESAVRRDLIRALAVTAIAVTSGYLAWRAVAATPIATWWVSVPLLLLEIHAAIGLVLLTIGLWDIDSEPVPAPVDATADRVAVLIPTLDESLDILTPTLAAALALDVEHETWVLDDGGRPEVHRLATDLGARYLSRPDATDGVAGNLNHALGTIEADVIAVLHADSVAAPDFLANTLGYLADPTVALVQTPEGFYNTDSFEHSRRDRSRPVHERTFAQRLLQPGRNRWRGAFWTGTGAVLRVAALRAIGGVATGTFAPDQHTTIRLHRAGWDTLAHNEVLARGLAPTSAAIDAVRRERRAAGAMQLIRTEDPMSGPGLTRMRRLSHTLALLAPFDAWRWLAIVILPIAILLTSANPIAADVVPFVVLAGLTYGLQAAARLALTRGCDRPLLSVLLRIVRMTPDLGAVRWLRGGRTPARAAEAEALAGATPKGRTSEVRRAASEPRLLRLLATVSVFAAAWFALGIMVSLALGATIGWASYAAWAWLMLDVFVLARAIGRVRDLRFGGERRASVRFETTFAGSFDGSVCDVLDVSLRGAGIRVSRPVDLTADRLVLIVDGWPLEIGVSVRSARADETGATVVGLEYLPDQNRVRAELALALFRTTVVPARAGEPAGTRIALDDAESAAA